MTKEELKLQSKIAKLEESNKKLEDKLKSKYKDKPLFNTKYLTTSKFALHFTHILALIVVIFVMYMSCKYLKSEPIYLATVLGALTTNIFVILGVTTKFYTDKAIADSDNINKKEKYEMKMKLAERMTDLLADNKVSADGVNLFKAVISESETSVNLTGGNGFNTVEQTNFGMGNISTENIAPLDISMPIENNQV